MSKKPPKTSEEQPMSQPGQQPAEMSTLERVKYLGDLANAVQDPNITKAIQGVPNGAHIYGIFVAAVSQELERIMDKSSEQEQTELKNLVSTIQGVQIVLGDLTNTIKAISASPAIIAIKALHAKLSGTEPQSQKRPPQPKMQDDIPVFEEPVANVQNRMLSRIPEGL